LIIIVPQKAKMKYFKYLTIVFYTFLLITSCSLKPKIPTFRDFGTIEDPDYSNGEVNIKGDIILYNPNRCGFNIDSAAVEVFVNQKKVSTIDKFDLTKVEIKKKSEIKIPFNVTFEAEKVYKGFLSRGLGLTTSSDVTFRLEGTVDFDVKGVKYTQPILVLRDIKISR
jgi:LEA14-like dessication related protein